MSAESRNQKEEQKKKVGGRMGLITLGHLILVYYDQTCIRLQVKNAFRQEICAVVCHKICQLVTVNKLNQIRGNSQNYQQRQENINLPKNLILSFPV